jgi:hypothetical protein
LGGAADQGHRARDFSQHGMRVQVQQQQPHGGQGGTAWGAQAQAAPSSTQRAISGPEGVMLQVCFIGRVFVLVCWHSSLARQL